MNIVVLDGFTANPGDLSWEPLAAYGELTVHERTPPDRVLERLAGAQVAITNKIPFDRARMEALPELKYLGVTATGYNIIDVAAARDRGIAVANVPAYSTASVAQMVFALLLEWTQQVGHHSRLVGEGAWRRSPDFCFWERPLTELDGLTLGLVGFGQIARRVARIAQAFGMRVLVHTRNPQKYQGSEEGSRVGFVALDQLLRESDVLSLHCPLTAETSGLLNRDRLALVKSGAYLINTARGPLVDEAALAEALREGRLGGAGLDVLSQEPPGDTPLQYLENCFITPHIAWATRAARQRLLTTVIDNVAAFAAGRPQNVVS